MSNQTTINRAQVSHASVTVNVDGEDFYGVSNIDYDSELATNPVHGTGHNQVGVTFGELKHNGSLEVLKETGARILAKLGTGYMKRLITITVVYRETAMSALHTDVLSAYIKKHSTKSQTGSDPVKDTFELHVNDIIRDGIRAVETE